MPFGRARHKPLICNSSRAGRCLGLSAFVLVLGSTALHNAAADSDTRTLKIHHTHTKEDITVTFKRNGRYDEAGLERLNRFLRDWRNDEQIKMDPQLFDIAWEVYQEVGAKEPIQIISAYRSPETNSMLRRRSRGVAQFSQHMLGKAIDFNIPDVPLDQIRAAGLRQQRGGVGFYPSSAFVHLDVGSVRHWPRMTHDQLVRVFPNGRTVHVPSDGRPLPGYELALADIERRGGSPSRVSLAYARDAGVIGADGASAAKPKRSLLARLFGIGEEDEDANEIAASRKAAAAGRGKAAEETKPVQMASLVPLPRVRPLAREPKPELGEMRMTAPSPAEIVRTRGPWPGRTVQATDPARPAERLVWQTGPQGRAIASSVGGRTVIEDGVPRPRPIELASVGETMTSLPSWPAGAREDRIPSELMLAYAAQQAPTSDHPSRTAPMGSLRSGQTAVARNPAPARTQAAAQLPAPKRLIENPWLRGVMLSPSIQDSMDVVATGGTDYRALTPLMRKPASAVAAGFSDDPAFEASEPQTFAGGPAVGFLPTVTFGRITASLR